MARTKKRRRGSVKVGQITSSRQGESGTQLVDVVDKEGGVWNDCRVLNSASVTGTTTSFIVPARAPKGAAEAGYNPNDRTGSEVILGWTDGQFPSPIVIASFAPENVNKKFKRGSYKVPKSTDATCKNNPDDWSYFWGLPPASKSKKTRFT